MRALSRVLPLALCLMLAACASQAPEQEGRLDYQKAVTLPPLDVPPPLQVPAEGADAVALPITREAEAQALLPKVTDVRVERAGDMRWLVVQGSPEDLWPQVRRFLEGLGLEIAREDPRVGVLETQWAENRADIPEGFIRGLISRIAPNLYSASTRDRYRVRLERGLQPGSTEIYVAHYGVEQVEQGETLVWQPRPSDPELTSELLSRLMLALGVPEERAVAELQQAATTPAAVRARLEGDAVLVTEGFARAWRRVGIALDRIGLIVEDLDRSQGLYWVRVSEEGEKQGWWDSLFGDEQEVSERSFRVKVQGSETDAYVTLENDTGASVKPATRQKVLGQLEEQLR
ncbi:MAG: outer membrane protein assembly factor BamC [Gammaproteobacteria bacterium]|nr:outer membrane protein assembly factor BamC [Gammaproteobacteria bacterium]